MCWRGYDFSRKCCECFFVLPPLPIEFRFGDLCILVSRYHGKLFASVRGYPDLTSSPCPMMNSLRSPRLLYPPCEWLPDRLASPVDLLLDPALVPEMRGCVCQPRKAPRTQELPPPVSPLHPGDLTLCSLAGLGISAVKFPASTLSSVPSVTPPGWPSCQSCRAPRPPSRQAPPHPARRRE